MLLLLVMFFASLFLLLSSLLLLLLMFFASLFLLLSSLLLLLSVRCSYQYYLNKYQYCYYYEKRIIITRENRGGDL